MNTVSSIPAKQVKIRNEMQVLEEEIRKHQYFYYLENSNRITDKEFDRLFQKLKKLEEKHPDLVSPNSPTHLVGSDSIKNSDFNKFTHHIPVLSLENTYNMTELNDWITKTGSEEIYSVEWKIDGASLVLYYEEGILKNAVTRGTGGIGDDITDNIKTIETIPHQISKKINLILRGEVFMNYEDFEEFNEAFGGRYANPRNLTAGSIKHKYASEVSKRPLGFYAYDIHFPEGRGRYTSHEACLEFIKELGFPVAPDTAFEIGNNLAIVIDKFKKNKDSMPFPIDGLVIKLNDLKKRDSLGETSHSPRWARAFKFESSFQESVIEDIIVQIGRTGKVTPKARIKPVSIAGTTVTYATLHNQDYINQLGIGLGAIVNVSKRGEIIPAVEEVLEPGPTGVFNLPTHCPTCGNKLDKIEDSIDIFCINSSCPDRLKQSIIFFCQKKQMNIDGLGEKQIQLLFDKGWIRDVSDLYKLKDFQDEIVSLEGYGEKSVNQLLNGIEESKSKDLRFLLPALGLNELGHKVTEILIEAGYNSIDSLIDLTKKNNALEILNQIHGIGPRTAQAIVEQLLEYNVLNLINNLKFLGLNFNTKLEEKSDNLVFSNQSWCVTGSFEMFQPREIAMDIIVKHGGRKVSNVSSKTSHLLYGEGAGSKLEKAESLGIQLVSEKDFLKLLKDSGIQGNFSQ